MKYGRRLKRMTATQLKKAREKAKQKELTFSTVGGNEITVGELATLMRRANQRLNRAKLYTTQKEYKSLVNKYETSLQATGAFKPGTTRYSITAMKKITPAKLRLVHAAVSTALASSYMTRKTYNAIDEKRYQSYLDAEYVNNREQYEMLRDFFSSEAWKQLHDAGVISSDQLVRILKDEVFDMGADASASKKQQIQDLLQRYSDALAFRDFARPNPANRRYKVIESDPFDIPLPASEWDELVNETYSTDDDIARIAGVKSQDEFYRLMREDLLKIVGGV